MAQPGLDCLGEQAKCRCEDQRVARAHACIDLLLKQRLACATGFHDRRAISDFELGANGVDRCKLIFARAEACGRNRRTCHWASDRSDSRRSHSRGEIVADVMQHEVYLKSYNERNGTDLVGVVQVPTPPMGLYSKKHRALADVKPPSRDVE